MDDRSLTIALCRYLGRIPGWQWDETVGVVFDPERPAVHYGLLPPSPDQGIAVRVYGIPANDMATERVRRVQFFTRGRPGDPGGADRLAGVLLGVLPHVIRMDGISEIQFSSMSPLGPDDNDRQTRSDNYLITLDNPEASAS